MITFRFGSLKRLAAALLAVTALTLMMVSGFSHGDAAAAGRYPKLTTQECDDLLKKYQAALESGEDFNVDDYFLPFYYGGCGPWGEEPPPGGGGEPSDPGPSNPGGSGGGTPSKPGKPGVGTTTTS